MKRIFAGIAATLLLGGSALAQVGPGGALSIGPTFGSSPGTISGTFTAGDLLAANAAGQVIDASNFVPSATANSFLAVTLTGTGTPSASVLSAQVAYAFMYINITSDVLNVAANGLNGVGLYVHMTPGGTGETGQRTAIYGQVVQTVLPTTAGNIVGIWGSGFTNVNLTGVGVFGGLWQANCAVGCTVLNLVASEFDLVNAGTATSVLGINITKTNADTTAGSTNDVAILVGSNGSSWDTVLKASNYNGTPGATINHGIDFSSATCTTDCFKSTAFSVTGLGAVNALNLNITGATVPTTGLFLAGGNTLSISQAGASIAFWGPTQGALYTPFTTNASVFANIRMTNNGGSAKTGFEIGNDTSRSEFTIYVNSSGNSSGNGANSTTINAIAGMWLQGNGNTGMTVSATGTITMPNITNVGGADNMCYQSTTGAVTWTLLATACVVSDEDAKYDMMALDPARSLDIVVNSRPISFLYRPERDLGNDHHLGFGAQTLARVAPELVTRDESGKPNAVKQLELAPVVFGAIQQLERRLEAVENRRH